jgi:hypothetical protein
MPARERRYTTAVNEQRATKDDRGSIQIKYRGKAQFVAAAGLGFSLFDCGRSAAWKARRS